MAGMTTDRGLTFETYQRWRRPAGVTFWVLLLTLNTVFNSLVAQIDHASLAAWYPWVWEWSSALLILLLIPAVLALERRWPLHFDSWRRNLPRHLLASVGFSVIHVGGMVLLRELAYRAFAGVDYHFGPLWMNFGYEYLKDLRTYFLIVAMISLHRLWLMRLQGEASLLAEPDDGPSIEPVERPERFLVRKLGRDFLISAREIEWLQASGNYVNLHLRGRDYPMRTTMAAIEARLDPTRYVRVHRSYVVNLDYLTEIEPLDTGDARLTLRDGGKIPCSRRYRAALRDRFSAGIDSVA